MVTGTSQTSRQRAKGLGAGTTQRTRREGKETSRKGNTGTTDDIDEVMMGDPEQTPSHISPLGKEVREAESFHRIAC
jgi:hypothetical protein